MPDPSGPLLRYKVRRIAGVGINLMPIDPNAPVEPEGQQTAEIYRAGSDAEVKGYLKGLRRGGYRVEVSNLEELDEGLKEAIRSALGKSATP